ncbi:MAG TPA: glutathione transferase GstA [Rhodospirillaceae bacterium]|nr:glutathione transferase GstA [Rhodospirillaceae bacterium]
MKLYYTPGACSLASHIALREAGLPFDLEAVDLGSKKTAGGADFLAINSKGYIPALALDDGAVLTEGVSIMLWVAAQAPTKGLAPNAASPQYPKLVEWMIFIATELHKAAGGLFNPAYPDEARTIMKANLARRLDWADQALAVGPFLMGNVFTVADGYLFTVFSWLPHLGLDQGKWPNLNAHFTRVKARPAVAAALKGEGLAG